MLAPARYDSVSAAAATAARSASSRPSNGATVFRNPATSSITTVLCKFVTAHANPREVQSDAWGLGFRDVHPCRAGAYISSIWIRPGPNLRFALRDERETTLASWGKGGAETLRPSPPLTIRFRT